jgi:hypothetical protein
MLRILYTAHYWDRILIDKGVGNLHKKLEKFCNNPDSTTYGTFQKKLY